MVEWKETPFQCPLCRKKDEGTVSFSLDDDEVAERCSSGCGWMYVRGVKIWKHLGEILGEHLPETDDFTPPHL